MDNKIDSQKSKGKSYDCLINYKVDVLELNENQVGTHITFWLSRSPWVNTWGQSKLQKAKKKNIHE